MRKEYIKPSLEVIHFDTESLMLTASNPEEKDSVVFDSRRKHQWDDEEAWDDFEDDSDY